MFRSRHTLAPIAVCVAALTVGLLYPALSAPQRDKEQEDKHPIDKALAACLEKNMSTGGMIQCYATATTSWDRQMNTDYKKLMGKLDTKGKTALKTAQLQWIKFRDAEMDTISGVYSKTDGTMYRPMAAEDVMTITRARAQQISGYLETLKIDQP
jgi:uncharacterized protein YecT (DUF1311 family)